MNPNEDKPVDLARNFRWVDQNTILFVNREGIEKMMEVKKDGLKELGSAKVPLFSDIQDYDHFYFRGKSSSLSDTDIRLKRGYQIFKSAYSIDWMREAWSLYDKMFKVDYTVDNV